MPYVRKLDMTPQEINRRYRELAKFSVTQGTLWRTRWRALALALSLSAMIAVLVVLAIANTLGVALTVAMIIFAALPLNMLAVFFWRTGTATYSRGLQYRQECLDEAKQFADLMGEE